MVNTRQTHSNNDSDVKMPVRSTNHKDSNSLNDGRGDKQDDSDFHPRHSLRVQSSWGRHLRTRYGNTSYHNMEHDHVRRHPIRSSRTLRINRIDSDDDLIDDSDLQYNDDDGDDDNIFTPIKTNSRFSERRISTRRLSTDNSHRHNIDATNSNANCETEPDENDVKDDDEGDAEGYGVRRSKRQRKLLYDNFNTSWILGTQTVLRGYPQMCGNRGNNEESNDDGGQDDQEERQQQEDTKPSINNDNSNVEEDDMYSKIKRTRRARIRYSPSNSLSIKSRLRDRSTRVTVAADSSEESDSRSDSDEVVPRRRRRRRRRDTSSDDGRVQQNDKGRVYHLRQNKPVVDRFQVRSEPTRRSSRLVLCPVRPRRFQRKPRDSSSSDEERFQRKKAKSMAKARSRCMPLNYKPSDAAQLQKTPVHSSKSKTGGVTGPADVDPMTIDTSVTFEKVGGLEGHLQCLKEMVVFPMMYREIFEKFKIQPPKGVLFHGPPGTGKTLIARALANECSQGDRKVSFFMRKGADCLSKWVGESERQLRLLFEQAYQMKPSIIFFDEIDGLAPVRSSKQDQIHASIVSTLLALLDGLDDRGEIIVIGATNRIDAIDPALRRPGRFDRELYFPLPGRQEREEILKIHTRPWTQTPAEDLISQLAEKSVGYCGSDLRLLCSEAVVQAMRRRYPQIYKSNKKLLLQADNVQVQESDFKLAQSKIIPASCRVNPCPGAKLSRIVRPLLEGQFDKMIESINAIFPHAALLSRNQTTNKVFFKPRYLIHGEDEMYGQTTHLAPALLDYMEHIPVHNMSLSTMLEMTNRSTEEAIIQIMREATRNPPSIVYLPSVDKWWSLLPCTSHAILLERIKLIPISSPVLILATSDCSYQELDVRLKSVFTNNECVQVNKPNREERERFFENIIVDQVLKEPEQVELREEEWEELPLAPPPPPPPPSQRDLEELHNKEEHKLRELRIFLRDICAKLARNRQFFMFTKPVDIKEVPDYLNIILRPMDLETMMTNIDLHRYNSAQEFLKDIDLIVHNALEYNPDRNPEDKLIRHRACSLRDTAYTLIKAEMDTDFEDECREISRVRKERDEKKTDGQASAQINGVATLKEQNTIVLPRDDSSDVKQLNSAPPQTNHINKRRRLETLMHTTSLGSKSRIRKRTSWAKGFLKKKKPLRANTSLQSNKSMGTISDSIDNQDVSTVGDASSTKDLDSADSSSIVDNINDNSLSGKHSNSSLDVSKKNKESPKQGTSKTPPTTPVKINETPTLGSSNTLGVCGRRRGVGIRSSKTASDVFDKVTVDVSTLQQLVRLFVNKTDGFTIDQLHKLYSTLDRIVFNYRQTCDRRGVVEDFQKIVMEIQQTHGNRRGQKEED